MTEQQEFLNKLKYPNREKVKRHVQIWIDSLTGVGILDKRITIEDNVHTIYITTDSLDKFTSLDLSFTLYFRANYSYGKPSYSSVVPPPECLNEYTNAYYIYEY